MIIIRERFEELLKSGRIPDSVLLSIVNKYDTTVRVDRSIRTSSDIILKNPEQLEINGPVEFDVEGLEIYHPKQMDAPAGFNIPYGMYYAKYRNTYEELLAKEMLDKCLDFDELKAIRARGMEFFLTHFGGYPLHGWKQVFVYDGDDIIPSLRNSGGSMVVSWIRLEEEYYCSDPLTTNSVVYNAS